jgi:hypothetical protein
VVLCRIVRQVLEKVKFIGETPLTHVALVPESSLRRLGHNSGLLSLEPPPRRRLAAIDSQGRYQEPIVFDLADQMGYVATGPPLGEDDVTDLNVAIIGDRRKGWVAANRAATQPIGYLKTTGRKT